MAEASSAGSLGPLFSSLEVNVKTAIQHSGGGGTVVICEGTSSWHSLQKLFLFCLPISSDQGPSPGSGPPGPILGLSLPLFYSLITLSGGGIVCVSGGVSGCHGIPSPGHLKLVGNNSQVPVYPPPLRPQGWSFYPGITQTTHNGHNPVVPRCTTAFSVAPGLLSCSRLVEKLGRGSSFQVVRVCMCL